MCYVEDDYQFGQTLALKWQCNCGHEKGGVEGRAAVTGKPRGVRVSKTETRTGGEGIPCRINIVFIMSLGRTRVYDYAEHRISQMCT
jgi:hypothetical protein